MKYPMIREVSVVRLHSGITLIEMLISLALSTVLITITVQFYVDIFNAQRNQRELLNLQQNAHQLLNVMQKHIQHMGYQGVNRSQSNYSLFLKNNQAYDLSKPQCLVFFYDINGDGCIGNRNKTLSCNQNGKNKSIDVQKEIIGFKFLNKNILTFDDDRIVKCIGEKCQSWSDCDRNKWRSITDSDDFQVEKLAFYWENSNVLLRIELILQSVKDFRIKYGVTAYSYLLNSGE